MLQKQGVPIEQAYLFGSWAKGTQQKDSDIDLAVVSSVFRDWEQKNRLLTRVKRAVFSDIEPHGFHPKNFKPKENPVAYEIVKHGIRII